MPPKLSDPEAVNGMRDGTRSSAGKQVQAIRRPVGRSARRGTGAVLRSSVDAENHLTAIESSKLRGEYVDPMLGRVTYGEFAESVLAVKVNQRPTTQARDECAFRLMILPYFAKRRLNSIEVMDIKAWIAKLAPSYAPATIHKAYQLFASVFQEAAEMGIISKSPCWKINPSGTCLGSSSSKCGSWTRRRSAP
jgi:hypothetical protein